MKPSRNMRWQTTGASSVSGRRPAGVAGVWGHTLLLPLFLFIAVCSLFAGLAIGSVSLSLDDLISALLGRKAVATDIVWSLRAPRVFAAFCVGALLAIAGSFLQVLLRNPLADPYIFGVSGGAAAGVLFAMLLGLDTIVGYGFGLGGAAGATLLVAALSYRVGDWNPYRLLLTGVVVAAGLSSAISLILVLAPDTSVKGMLFWLMGDLAYADVPNVAVFILIGLVVFALPYGQAMNALGLGRMKAASLGIATRRLELTLYFASALATTCAVLIGGTIGFVGLVVPHLVRLCGIHDHRLLVPSAALLGGSLLVVADIAARSAWAPIQLPVGVLTALIGVPILLLLIAGRGNAAH